ncbi:MAG: response regulator transcription factor [Spirochaetales bacterium]|nr:response regulator transcription factor [Spirochaetales bacterium]
MTDRILVVEDDKKISRIIELQLRHNGYDVDTAQDGSMAERIFHQNEYSLILLDIMIPRVNGFELCGRIRRESDIPIIMLTAKDDVTDKVLGLDFGANDYMTKPFEFEELLARIRVQLRQKNEKAGSGKINIDGLEINPDSMTVSREGEAISLTRTEFDLLLYLAGNRGIVLRRDLILQRVWGDYYAGNDNVLDVYIKYLRDKIEKPFRKKVIETVRGTGYVIR